MNETKIGIQVPRFHWPGGPENMGTKLAEIARTADRSGFSSLWVMDHFYQVGQGYGAPGEPMLEGYTALAYMAAVTSRVKLGTMVTGCFYRHPGILLKTVTTLDILSGGRGMLGIGAGWYDREAKGMGAPYPETAAERLSRLEETLKIAKHMWSDDRSTFEGKYYRLEEPICSPQPLSKPHPPIMIGGEGERKTLRFVAKYGDACNLHLGAHPKLRGYTERSYENYRDRFERLTHKLNVLRRHCERVGRDYEDIETSVLSPLEISPSAMTVEEVIEMCEELAGIGIQHVIFNMPNDHEIEPIEVIGEDIIQQVKDL
ncbi:MAG: LLM class F420-dependent oxidoreductase [Candidatus Bathyarchaeota archaeon]|nr:LLM class F420-dependent oxidoreductase [Candidatus Bathyarchaeota archaeon]MDH5790811.1 LLM class F420-dependent oxidoreductase [Candidatus Bathyarchaeota archaeon]